MSSINCRSKYSATSMPSLNPNLDRKECNSSYKFFENAKTPSSIGKFYVGGTYYAIPYPTVSRAQPAGSNTEFVSEYGRNFVNPSYEYSSMSNKTLQKYNALAYRNRNAFPDPPIPGWNTSTLDLSRKAGYTEKRRFVTSNQAVHTGARLDPRTHAGITAYETKWRRLQREK